MGKPTSSENFKRSAVRGSPVREVSERLGVSTHSLYKRITMYAQALSMDHEAENRRLKRELARMTEERDILREAAA